MKIFIFLLIVSFFQVLLSGCTSRNDSTTVPSSLIPASSTATLTTSSAEWVPDGLISQNEYQATQNYNDIQIYWRVDPLNIYLGITAGTTGWIALAFQPGSRMKNADMLLGLVKNGQVLVQDAYSEGDFGPHHPDTELGGIDNILASGGKEEGTKTTIELKRLLNTGDNFDQPLSGGINKIIWATGGDDNFDSKHRTRGYGEISIP